MGEKGKLIPPGQTEIRYGGMAGELVLPLWQWTAIMGIRLGLVLGVAWLVVLWGPYSLYVGIPGGLVWLLVAGPKVVQWGARLLHRPAPDNVVARYAIPVLVTGLLMAWLGMWATETADALWPTSMRLLWWDVPLRFTWGLHVVWRVLGSLPVGVYFWSYPHIIYRLRYEIADPWWPGPIKERLPESGPAFPGVPLRSEEMVAKEPDARLERVQVEVSQTSGSGVRAMDRIDLLTGPNARRRMREAAEMILAGRPISEGELAGPGKPLAAGAEFRGFQDSLLDRGLVVWRRPGSPTQGVVLTVVGRKVFERLAGGGNGREEPAPPAWDGA